MTASYAELMKSYRSDKGFVAQAIVAEPRRSVPGRSPGYPAGTRPSEKGKAMPKRRRKSAAKNPKRKRSKRAASNPRSKRKSVRSAPRRARRRARAAVANPRKRRRARAAVANPRKRRRARAAVANPRKRRRARAAVANPRKRRRARAAVANPRKRRRARAAVANPVKRRRHRRASANPTKKRRRSKRHLPTLFRENPIRRHARENPHNSIKEILSAVAASGAGYLGADFLHRYLSTRFAGLDGSPAANAQIIASPPGWQSMAGQATLAVAPFLAAHFAGKHLGPATKSALQGLGIGAAAHLAGQIVTKYVLVKVLNMPELGGIGSRLYPAESKAQDGTLSGHPPLVEEMRNMFPPHPHGLLQSFGVGNHPSFTAGSYATPYEHIYGHQHHGMGAPPPPPPPPPPGHPAHQGHHGHHGHPFGAPPPGAPMIPVMPMVTEGPRQFEGRGGGIQLTQPCNTVATRANTIKSLYDLGERELRLSSEATGLGRLPFQMNPDRDPRDAE